MTAVAQTPSGHYQDAIEFLFVRGLSVEDVLRRAGDIRGEQSQPIGSIQVCDRLDGVSLPGKPGEQELELAAGYMQRIGQPGKRGR